MIMAVCNIFLFCA